MNRQIAHGLTVAGVTLVTTNAIVVADKLNLISEDMTIRLIMAVCGMTMVWSSNMAPKLAKGHRPALTLAVNRTMVLSGLAFTIAWLTAPMDWALWLSMGGVFGAMCVVVGIVIGSCLLTDKRAG